MKTNDYEVQIYLLGLNFTVHGSYAYEPGAKTLNMDDIEIHEIFCNDNIESLIFDTKIPFNIDDQMWEAVTTAVEEYHHGRE